MYFVDFNGLEVYILVSLIYVIYRCIFEDSIDFRSLLYRGPEFDFRTAQIGKMHFKKSIDSRSLMTKMYEDDVLFVRTIELIQFAVNGAECTYIY